MNDYMNNIFLKELDSVYTDEEHKQEAEHALFNALLYEGKTVVFTYNQIADSTSFLNIMINDEANDVILDLFRESKIRVNKYKPNSNISEYVQKRLKEVIKGLYNQLNKPLIKDDNFIISSLSFLDKYTLNDRINVYEAIYESICYCDLGTLNNKVETILNEDDFKKCSSYAEFIIKINLYVNENKCFVVPRECHIHNMQYYVYKANEYLLENKYEYHVLFSSIINEIDNQTFTRSALYKIINNNEIYNNYRDIFISIVDLCYNYTLGYSVCLEYSDDRFVDDMNSILIGIKQNKTILNNNKYSWKTAYRLIGLNESMRKFYIFKKINLSWRTTLLFTPILSISRLLACIFLSIVIDLFLDQINILFEALRSFAILFILNGVIDLFKEKTEKYLPKWFKSELFFRQIYNFMNDCKLAWKRRI